MQYRSQSRGRTALQTGTSLAEQNARGMDYGHFAAGSPWQSGARMALPDVQGLREKPHGESDTDHQQQELFVLVAARLAADEVFRAGVRGNRYRARRCLGA